MRVSRSASEACRLLLTTTELAAHKAVARMLLGEEHLAERSEVGSHFDQFCVAHSAPRKFWRFQCLFRDIMLQSIDFSAAGDFFSKNY